jgi:hypothetical protein
MWVMRKVLIAKLSTKIFKLRSPGCGLLQKIQGLHFSDESHLSRSRGPEARIREGVLVDRKVPFYKALTSPTDLDGERLVLKRVFESMAVRCTAFH